MDAKFASLVERHRDRVEASTFAEDDMLVLLILLRDLAPDGSPVREFADFIAHRERDRGLVFNYLNDVRENILDFVAKKRDLDINVQPVYSTTGIEKSLADCFAAAGVGSISALSARRAILCLYSLLQGALIIDRSGSAVGDLFLAYSQAEISLCGGFRIPAPKGGENTIVVPVLTMENDFFPVRVPEPQRPGTLTLSFVAGDVRASWS